MPFSRRDIRAVSTATARTPLVGLTHSALRVTTKQGNEFWFPGSPDAAALITPNFPGADVRDAMLASLPAHTEDAGIISGQASNNTGSYSIADINQDASDAFAERFANQQAFFGSRLELHQCADGETFSSSSVRKVTLGVSFEDADGELILSFQGVLTRLKSTLFTKRTWRVAQTFSSTSLFLPVYLPQRLDTNEALALPVFEHTDNYSLHPGQTVGYLRLPNNEIVSYSATQLQQVDGVYGIPLDERNLYGTISETISVDAGTIRNNAPEVTEFVMFDEPLGDALSLLITGEFIGRQFPEHWTEGVSSIYFDDVSVSRLSMLYPDERVRFDDPDPEKSIDFIRNKLLRDLPAVLLESDQGTFEVRPLPLLTGDAEPVEVLDPSKLDMDQEFILQHEVDQLKNPLIIKHSWDPVNKLYRFADTIFDQDTYDKYGELESHVIEYRGWNSAIGTSTALLQSTAFQQDRYQAPTKIMNVTALPSFNYLRVGDIVELDLPGGHVLDALTGNVVATPVKLSMVIAVKSVDGEGGNVDLVLFSTTGRAARRALNVGQTQLEPEAYEALAPDSLDSIVAPTGTTVKTYSGAHTVAGNKFYRIDHASAVLASDFKLTPSTNCQFLGIAFQGDLLVNSTDCAIDMAGKGAFAGTTSTAGNPGYIGRTRPAGGMDIQVTDDDSFGFNINSDASFAAKVKSIPAKVPVGGPIGTFTGFRLKTVDGRLQGIPRTLAGSGGGANGGVSVSGAQWIGAPDDVINAGIRAGSRGGGSAIFLGPRLSRAPTGVYADVSAADTVGAMAVWGSEFYAGSPGSGSPGVLAVIVDGDNPQPAITEGAVRAYTGNTTPTYNLMRTPDEMIIRVKGDGAQLQSYYRATPRENRWKDHSAVMYVPASDSLQELVLSDFEALAIAEVGFDGRSRLWPIDDQAGSPIFPANADVNDYAALLTDLDNHNVPYANVRIWRKTASGWQQVIFSEGKGDVVAEFRIQQYRDRGTLVLWVTDTRPAIGSYAIGDSWFSKQTRRLVYLGATAAQDTLVEAHTFSDGTGLNFLADTNAAGWLSGLDTLWFGRDIHAPLIVPGTASSSSTGGTGITTDTYHRQPMVPFQYEIDGVVAWAASGDSIVSASAAGSGDAVAFYQSGQGFLPDSAPRDAWVYAKGTGTIKLQAAGDATNTGDPGLQISASINSTSLTWTKLSGTFGAYAAQLQVRTQDAGITVASVIVIEAGSTSVPDGPLGFGGGSGVSGSLGHPYHPSLLPLADRTLPLASGSSAGPVEVGEYGENGGPGIRIQYNQGGDIVVAERFPFRVSAGNTYMCSARVKNTVSTGFSNPADMGVALQFDGYDIYGTRVVTTDVHTAGADAWLSKNSNGFLTLSDYVEIPQTTNKVAWGELKVVVTGNATGHCDISSRSVLQSPFNVYEYSISSYQDLNAFTTGLGQTNLQVVPTNGKKGDIVHATIKMTARTDAIDPNNPSNLDIDYAQVYLSIKPNYIDSDGNVLTAEEYNTPFASIQYESSDESAIRYKSPLLTDDPSDIAETRESKAKADFNFVSIYYLTIDNTVAKPSNHLYIDDLDILLMYGQNFDDGYN